MAHLLKTTTMNFPENQIEELKKIAPLLSTAQEGGYNFFLINDLSLPEGCEPIVSDILLCPTPRDGYESRIFYASKITGCPARNWNTQIRVLERNWYAFSWRVKCNLRLAEILLVHLNALRK